MYLKKVSCLIRKSSYSEKAAALKNYLFSMKQLLGGGFALKKQVIWKEILRKGDCSKKEAAPKK